MSKLHKLAPHSAQEMYDRLFALHKELNAQKMARAHLGGRAEAATWIELDLMERVLGVIEAPTDPTQEVVQAFVYRPVIVVMGRVMRNPFGEPILRFETPLAPMHQLQAGDNSIYKATWEEVDELWGTRKVVFTDFHFNRIEGKYK